jgi:5-methylcytosine-specific restriction protein A
MPMRAPKACHCGTLNCTVHTAQATMHERDLWRKLKENNPLVSLYKTKRWQALRRRLLSLFPVCVECNNALATDVDHIIDARTWVSTGRDFYDEANLQCLCHSCHAKKTGAELSHCL